MWELKKEIENRKENLIYTLKNKKDFLGLEKQHQMYGAIKELDHILNLIENQRESEMLNKTRQLDLKPYEAGATEEEEEEIKVGTEKKPALNIVGEKVKKFKVPIKIRFAKSDA